MRIVDSTEQPENTTSTSTTIWGRGFSTFFLLLSIGGLLLLISLFSFWGTFHTAIKKGGSLLQDTSEDHFEHCIPEKAVLFILDVTDHEEKPSLLSRGQTHKRRFTRDFHATAERNSVEWWIFFALPSTHRAPSVRLAPYGLLLLLYYSYGRRRR